MFQSREAGRFLGASDEGKHASEGTKRNVVREFIKRFSINLPLSEMRDVEMAVEKVIRHLGERLPASANPGSGPHNGGPRDTGGR